MAILGNVCEKSFVTAAAPQSSAAFLLVSLIVIQPQWKHIDCHLYAKSNTNKKATTGLDPAQRKHWIFWAAVVKVLFLGFVRVGGWIPRRSGFCER